MTAGHPEAGPERHVGNPLRMSRLDQRTATSAPCLGADTADVLTGLGRSASDIERLAAEGVTR